MHLVARFDEPGGKVILPLCYASREDNGKREWRWQAAQAPRPLYGLDRLARRPADPVVVVEGEKAADAAARILPGFVIVTSSGGSKAAGKADWSALTGRDVTIWPDADQPGRDYAAAVAGRLGEAKSIAVVEPPAGVSEGWDAADAESEGWSAERAAGLVTAAQPAGTGDKKPAAGKRTPQRDLLLGCTEFCDLWHDPAGETFITIPVNAHRENWPIRSRHTTRWLASKFYDETGSTIGGQALEDGLRILEARAANEGPEYSTWRRIGRHGGSLFLDLGDSGWRAVEITPDGWRMVAKPEVKFLRSPQMRPLPEPEAGEPIETLRRFVNVAGDDDFALLVGWLVGAFREVGPYPILIINGEQGSGKSGVTRLLRLLVDPAIGAIRAAPRDDRDLIVAATNSWVLSLDNLSNVAAWLSDGLCRLATGGGFATRMLHTDRDEAVFDAMRPIILNGIPLLAERADLADRAITLHLPAIPESERQAEDEFWADFDRARPAILGAILDAVSAAMRNVGSTRLAKAPRLADFAKWLTAAEPGLGWEPGSFVSIYSANRRDVSESAFEADPVATAIRDFVTTEHPSGWHGTATELLGGIGNRTAEGVRRSRAWPQTAQALGNRIDRIAPLLRSKGFAVDRRHSGVRTISIVPPDPSA